MINILDCATTTEFIALDSKCKISLNEIKSLWVCPDKFRITTPLISLESNTFVLENIANGNIIPFNNIMLAAAPIVGEAIQQDSNKDTLKISDGKRLMDFKVFPNPCSYNEFKKLDSNSSDFSFFIIDTGNRIIGVYEKDSDILLPFKIRNFLVYDRSLISNGVDNSLDGTRIQLGYSASEFNQMGVTIWKPLKKSVVDAPGLTKVTATINSKTTSLVSFMLEAVCGGIAISGLKLTDFELLNSIGVNVASTATFSEDDGLYSLNFATPLIAGTFTLKLKTNKDALYVMVPITVIIP